MTEMRSDMTQATVNAAIGQERARVPRSLILTAMLLVLIQSALGMVVNLYAAIPGQHPGAHATSYFPGVVSSIGWALSNGTGSLAVHAGLGLALILVAIAVATRCVMAGPRSAAILAVLATLCIIGAAFNGASFLALGQGNLSSLLMALLALGALTCYGLALYFMSGRGARQ
jgi:hypothetical protein